MELTFDFAPKPENIKTLLQICPKVIIPVQNLQAFGKICPKVLIVLKFCTVERNGYQTFV